MLNPASFMQGVQTGQSGQSNRQHWSVVQGKLGAGKEALEQAVGLDFSIRESAAYAGIKAQLLLAEGQTEEAERLLQAAMAIPGVKRALSSPSM